MNYPERMAEVELERQDARDRKQHRVTLAAAALQGLLAEGRSGDEDYPHFAEWSVTMADKVLKRLEATS